MPGKVYLLHFSAPYKHARHYIGFTTDIVERLNRHDSGQGARLLQVILDAGLTYKLAALIPGTRA